MNTRVKITETILIFFLSYTVVTEGLRIDCSNGTTTTSKPVKVEGEWTTWSSCNTTCGEGVTSRRRSCVHSVSKKQNICNVTQVDDGPKVCARTDDTSFLGSYFQWSPWSTCDFNTCANKPLYDKTRTRRSCVTSQNGCKYVEETEEVKVCKMPQDVLAVLKVVHINTTDTDVGWRHATVNDVVESINETKVALKDYLKWNANGTPIVGDNIWMVAKLQDGSVKGSSYHYQIDRNYTKGWAEKLLIQEGIYFGEKDNKWTEWGPCDAKCAPGEYRKKEYPDLGKRTRRRTCLNNGTRSWNGGGCRYTQPRAGEECMAGVKLTFPGRFGTWSDWSPCDVISCGNTMKDHTVRNRSTCVNYNVTSDNRCIYFHQYEEAKVCDKEIEDKEETKMKGLSTKMKIIASCGSWAVLLTVFIISAGSLRSKEVEIKKTLLLCKTKVKPEVNEDEVKEEEVDNESNSSSRGKSKKKRKKKRKEEEEEENGNDVEMSEEKKAEVPLLETMVEEC